MSREVPRSKRYVADDGNRDNAVATQGRQEPLLNYLGDGASGRHWQQRV